MHSFKAAHHIVSQKIDEFVTSKAIEDRKILEKTSETLINNVKSKVLLYGLSNTYNSDQSGFHLEMHLGRTLAAEGEK